MMQKSKKFPIEKYDPVNYPSQQKIMLIVHTHKYTLFDSLQMEADQTRWLDG